MNADAKGDAPETDYKLMISALRWRCQPDNPDQLDQEAADAIESIERRLREAEKQLERAQGSEADLAATLIRAERAEAELAKLKAHAEAMANSPFNGIVPLWKAIEDYRLDFPKE